MVGFECAMTRDDDCDNIGLGCALEHFVEAEEVINMIKNVKTIYNTPKFEAQYDRLYVIMKQYYEQPHLLDPHLEKMLEMFTSLIKDKESTMELKHAVFYYMYQIIRVRGHKIVVRYLPHEVSDLLMVLPLLEAQDPKDQESWRSRFVLLLWLSIVVMIPFPLSRLDGFSSDSQGEGSSKKLTVMERIYNLCKTYALSKDASAEVDAYLASKFLTRSDVKEVYLGAFFDWAMNLHSGAEGKTDIHYGVLAAVAAVLKHGKRDDLLPYASSLLEWVIKQNYKNHHAILVRKYVVKMVQRIGLTYLRPRVVSWRYTRGSRSLAMTLGAITPVQDSAVTPNLDTTEADFDIVQEVEEVVELLLWCLRDEDTVVRWCAAKGVGRVSARLPAAAAADVAASVLALFGGAERDAAWHGGCMALAELARRGLLSPSQLGEAVSAVNCALRRDEARGGGGGGGGGRAARDAACHAAWAMARAYDAAALKPHALKLATALIATACFDREINCRRAASAAYQENVGRHGMFPHGIDVLTTADFQSVGPRNNAYLVIAPQIASYPEYAVPLIDHVVELKIEHWDCAVRELAAQALHRLTFKAPEYVAEKVLPKLMTMTQSIDLNVRHGAILAIGEAVHALSLHSLDDGSKADTLISEDMWEGIRGLVSRFRSRGQLLGLGGSLMRQACCQCIASLSLARANITDCNTIDEWLNLIEECISHEVEILRQKAITALALVFEQYLSDDSRKHGDTIVKEKREELIHKYCEQLSDVSSNGLLLRMGYAKALGSLPKSVIHEYLPTILKSLIQCAKITDSTQKWAESRRDAIIGLTNVCQTEGIEGINEFVPNIFEMLIECLSEYTNDVRGDIGAWVREASMAGILNICRLCAVGAPHHNSAEIIPKIMCMIAQQAVEKIDRTRAHAGKTFVSLVYFEPTISNIPHHEQLKVIFPANEVELQPSPTEESHDGDDETKKGKNDDDDGEMKEGKGDGGVTKDPNVVLWLYPGHTMPRFVQLLEYPIYRYNLLKGFIVSGGELTESLVKHTTQSLFAFLQSKQNDKETLQQVCDTIIQVFADNIGVKRIVASIFNFLDRLLNSGTVSPILEDPKSTFAMDILKYLQMELKRGGNIYKLLDSINVLCQLIQVQGEVCSKALFQLAIYLCYAERYVRRCAAARLFEAFTLYGDVSCVPPENLEKVMTVLEETDWERPVAELRPIRNDLCDLMGIRKPVMKQKAAP